MSNNVQPFILWPLLSGGAAHLSVYLSVRYPAPDRSLPQGRAELMLEELMLEELMLEELMLEVGCSFGGRPEARGLIVPVEY